jgi:hypothetical protein
MVIDSVVVISGSELDGSVAKVVLVALESRPLLGQRCATCVPSAKHSSDIIGLHILLC